MKFTCAAFVSLAVAVGTSALVAPRSECENPEQVGSSFVSVGGNTVAVDTFSCANPTRRDLAARDPTDVCGVNCTDVCANSGSLPPTTDDCGVIFDAITILNGSVAPEFTVLSGHMQTLSFGTCRVFFQNFGPSDLEYCWLSLGQVSSAAGSACLPPVQPVNSEGLCIAGDGTWRVGIAHS